MKSHKWATREVDCTIEIIDEIYCEECGVCTGDEIITGIPVGKRIKTPVQFLYRNYPNPREIFYEDCDKEKSAQRDWEEKACNGRGQNVDWARCLNKDKE